LRSAATHSDLVLIGIKPSAHAAPIVVLANKRSRTMDTASIIILAGIVVAFALFAGTLMWSDLQTRRFNR
jgi:uncharacterized membrane protein YgdD (TMEM256/DUF423 family)